MYSHAPNESKLNIWVAAQKDGSVICAQCDCMDSLDFSTFVYEISTFFGHTIMIVTVDNYTTLRQILR